MEYPIDDRTFSELLRIRDCMVQENPHSDRIGIALPFLPWIGSDIREGAPGIYFIGQVTRGEMTGAKCDLKHLRHYSEVLLREKLQNPDSSFWHYLKAIAEKVYDRPWAECIARIAWSNQLKIGIYKRRDGSPSNPRGVYAKRQLPVCRAILEHELQLAGSSAVLFLGDGRLIYPLCGKREEWDAERYRGLGVWLKYRANGAPILYQEHPRRWQFCPTGRFQEHVDVVAPLLRQYLASHVDKKPSRDKTT